MKNDRFIYYVVFLSLITVLAVVAQYLLLPLIVERLPERDREPPDAVFPGESEPDTLARDIQSIYQVHFIDVGQGDAILVQSPAMNILVDGGDRNTGVTDYLLQLAVDTLHLLVATHPHADHIGGLPEVLTRFAVLEVMDPGVVHSTRLFTRYLQIIDSLDIPFTVGRTGMKRQLDERAHFEVLHPETPSERHLNDASVVMWFFFDQIRVLLTGDVERRSESEILTRYPSLPSHVLKVAHHGSTTSSSQPFIDAVRPEVAVIFCGADNIYGFPHDETMQVLMSSNALIFRTDISGTVVMHTDGEDYYFVSEAGGAVPGDGMHPGHGQRVDINRASAEELTAIIHIGPARAREVIDNRPFGSVDELIRVPGIDARRLEAIKEQNIAFVNQP